MNLRPHLVPPPLDSATVQQLTDLAERVITALDTGDDYAPLVAEFNMRTRQTFTIADFEAAAGSIELQSFVETALCPEPVRVEDVTDAELLEIIVFLFEGLGSESEQAYWLTFLERNLPHPNIVELIFHTDGMSPEQILASAKAYRPIRL